MMPDVQCATGISNSYLACDGSFRSGQDSWAAPTLIVRGRHFLNIYFNHGHSHLAIITIPAPISSSIFTPTPWSTQMEVDTALYFRALESIDPDVTQKIFVDLGIPPHALCHTWFTLLFVEMLLSNFLSRVCDTFSYEGMLTCGTVLNTDAHSLSAGMPFLLQVALSLTIIYRKPSSLQHQIVNQKVHATHARPPPQWLPPMPDVFLPFAFRISLPSCV